MILKLIVLISIDLVGMRMCGCLIMLSLHFILSHSFQLQMHASRSPIFFLLIAIFRRKESNYSTNVQMLISLFVDRVIRLAIYTIASTSYCPCMFSFCFQTLREQRNITIHTLTLDFMYLHWNHTNDYTVQRKT